MLDTKGLDSAVKKNPVRATVTSVSSDGRTAKVDIPRVVAQKKYSKRLHLVTSVFVDTFGKSVSVGSKVSILPCRRVSKSKCWRVIDVRNEHTTI